MLRWFWVFAALLWTAFLAFGTLGLPALGPLLDVHDGLWGAQSDRVNGGQLEGLTAKVQVTFDEAGVPHFFAENEADLYRAQGYVMASQRLFQMDVSSRITASELSELVGERALLTDEFFLKFGMRESVLADLERYSRDPQSVQMLESFVAGINAYVREMKALPPEYRVLGAEPKLFKPIHVLHMAKLLTFSLAARSHDLALTRVHQQVGAAALLELFPEFHPAHLEDFVFENTSGVPVARETPDMFRFVSTLQNIPKFPLPNPGNGSNNWAIQGRRSSTGYTLLANDTHLGLSLPNIWYENQLSCPQFNVYGVSLNTVPGVILGLNRDIAWATTNGTTDVLDFYEIEFVDENSLSYLVDSQMLEAEVSEQTIHIKGRSPQVFQVVKTRLGYLLHREGKKGLVADWLAHETAGAELKAVRGLWSSKTFAQCLSALKSWRAPLQNFICADRDNISIQHTGAIPDRPVGHGRVVMDGRVARLRLSENLSKEALPVLINPAEGVVESANQKVMGPGSKRYMGWDYEEAFRGMKIRRALAGKRTFTPEDMLNLQNSDDDLEAETLLPRMLQNLSVIEAMPQLQEQWLGRLRRWDFKMRADSVEATLFKRWLAALKEELWSDDWEQTSPAFYPKSMRVAWLLERLREKVSEDQKWLSGSKSEIQAVLLAAWSKAWSSLENEYGKNPDRWTWNKIMRPKLRHVGRFPGFGAEVSQMSGSSTGLRGLSERHGPVYKLVVAFSKNDPQAWIQVPGHNEGNPLSVNFDKHVEDWAAGKMRSVHFYRNVTEALENAHYAIELLPAQENP